MRRLSLLLCALLMAVAVYVPVGVSHAKPAHASGVQDRPPYLISPAPNQLIVFEPVNFSPTIYYRKSWNGSVWSGWTAGNNGAPTPHDMASGVAVAGGAVFAQLTDGHLYCGTPWSQFTGGIFSTVPQNGTPAALNENSGFVRLLVVDQGGVLWTGLWQISSGCSNPQGSFWTNTSANTGWTAGLSGTSDTDYLMVAVGTDTHPYWSYNGALPWQQVNPAGGQCAGAMGLSTWGGGRYDLFCRGTDGQLWHNWNNQGWEALGGSLITGPSCVSWAAPRIDCVAIGQEGHVWIKSWDGTQWAPWADLGSA